MKNFVQCTLIPIGCERDHGEDWLIFSVFLTPLITLTDEPSPLPISGLFQEWPGKARISLVQAKTTPQGEEAAEAPDPSAEHSDSRRYMRWTETLPPGFALSLDVDGKPTVESADIFLDFTWWREVRPKPDPVAWWHDCMQGVKVRGVGDPTLGATQDNVPRAVPGPNGAQAQEGVAAVQDPHKIEQPLRDGQNTAEGLSSDEINQCFVGPFLRAHALQENFAPENDPTGERLAGAREALRRLDRAGSAGRSSLREKEEKREAEEEEGASGADVKGRTDFLEFLSAIGEHPALLRLFGLLFDIRVRRSLVTDAAVGDGAVFGVSASLEWANANSAQALQKLEHRRATLCRVHREGSLDLFTPASRAYDPTLTHHGDATGAAAEADASHLLRVQNGVFLRAKNEASQPLVHTVQSDLIAGLRAVLAEVDEKKNNPQLVPAARRRFAPLDHGIAAFLRDFSVQDQTTAGKTKAVMTRSLNRLGESWHTFPEKWKQTLAAEDLLRGFVVEVKSRAGDRAPWSDWQSLNWRETTFIRNPDIPQSESWLGPCGEGALALELSEARQPLSGWLLGPLPGVMLALTDEEREQLKFETPPDDPAAKYPAFLLATVFGLIVVLDGPVERSTKKPESPDQAQGVLGELLQNHFREHDAFRFGQWIELTGFVNRNPANGYFIATGAQAPPDTMAGLAGTLRSVTHDPGADFLRLDIARWELPAENFDGASGQAGLRRAPSAQVFLRFKANQPGMTPAAVVAKAVATQAALYQWTDGANPLPSLMAGGRAFFTGRGVPAFIAGGDGSETDAGQIGFASNGVLLELLNFNSNGPSVFLMPGLPGSTQAGEVKLDVSGIPPASAHVLGDPKNLTQGARYRVSVQRQQDKIIATQITEEATPSKVEIGEIVYAGPSSATVTLKLPGSDEKVSVDANTEIAIQEEAPAPAAPANTAQPAPGDDFSGEELPDESAEGARASAVRTLGKWPEHGLRVAVGDGCRAFLTPVGNPTGGQPAFRVSRLEILSHDPARVRLGRVSPVAGDNEAAYKITLLSSVDYASQSTEFAVTDETIIVAPPAAEGLPWRTVESPPPGGLAKVFLHPDAPRATRVEVLNSLSGWGRVVPGAGLAHAFFGRPLFGAQRAVPLAQALAESLSRWSPLTNPPPQHPPAPPSVQVPGQPAMTAAGAAAELARRLTANHFPPGLDTTRRLADALATALAADPAQRSFSFDGRTITSPRAADRILNDLARWERPPLPVPMLNELRRALAAWRPGSSPSPIIVPGLPLGNVKELAEEISGALERDFPGSVLANVRLLARDLAKALGLGQWSFTHQGEWLSTDEAATRLLQKLQEWETPRLRLRLPALSEDLSLTLPLDLLAAEDGPLIAEGTCSVALIRRPVGEKQDPREMVARLTLVVNGSFSRIAGVLFFRSRSGRQVEVVEAVAGTVKASTRVVTATLVWQGAGARPAATEQPAPGVKVTGQVRSFDEAQRTVSLLILRAPRNEPGLAPGRLVPFYFVNVWDVWKPVLKSLQDSGVPLEFTADVGVSIEEDAADWDVLKWPVVNSVKGTRVDVTPYYNATLAPPDGKSMYFRSRHNPDAKLQRVRLVVDGSAQGAARYPELLVADPGIWPTIPVNLTTDPHPVLLPDQFLVEDGIFTWFGDSIAIGNEGEAAIPSAEKQPHEPAAHPRRFLDARSTVPPHSLPELRVGWSYQFRLRAVYLSGVIPRGYCRGYEPGDAAFDFLPFGGYVSGQANRFLRLDPISPPRVGWPFNAQGRQLFAPDSPDSGEVENGVRYLSFLPEAGAPTELLLYSDCREPGSFQNLLGSQFLAPRRILLRPPEATVRQIERFGKFDEWLDQHHNDADRLYRTVILPRDRVEVEVVEDRPKQVGATSVKRWEIASTPGLLLPRLPDPDSDEPRFVLNGTALSPVGPPRFQSGKWPAWQDLFLEAQTLPDGWTAEKLQKHNQQLGNHSGAEGDPLRLYVPRDAGWTLEIHACPTEKARERLALHALLKGLAAESPEVAKALALIESGEHPTVSPPVAVRIRHLTNRPAGRPILIDLIHTRPASGKTLAELTGVYELDVPSTGTLSMQAAMEIAWIDDPAAALPLLPPTALRRLVYSEDPSPPSPETTPPREERDTARFLGRSSDGVDRLETSEYILTELPLTAPSVIDPLSESRIRVRWQHDLGDRRHHTVFYRALALSRFREYFPPGQSQPNPLPGPFNYQQATKIEKAATARNFNDPWGWHRVEMPATARPELPVVREAPPLYQWDPAWTPEGDWQSDGRTWSFSRTRSAGCRIWLERPWFSSGANEKLAVICLRKSRVPRRDKDRYLRVVSRWGKDPIHETDAEGTPLGLLTLDQVLSAEQGTRGLPTLEAAPKEPLQEKTGLAGGDIELADNLRVSLAVHTPLFHAQARAWFADVLLRAPAYTPFVWLSLARYQPHALEGLALSRPVRLEHPVQIWPTRTLSIELAPAVGGLRVSVRLAGQRSKAARRAVVCRVERLVQDNELFVPPLPAEDAGEIRQTAAPFPTADGSNIWQAVGFLDANGESVYEIDLDATPNGKITEARVIHNPRWPANSLFRMAVCESELHFTAYELQDAQRTASRPVYEDTVLLPTEATKGLCRK